MRSLLFIAGILCFSAMAWAGPNWQAIEEAREAKASEKQLERDQVVQAEQVQQSKLGAYEKLVAACHKVAGNAELTAACDEIKAAYAELEAEAAH